MISDYHIHSIFSRKEICQDSSIEKIVKKTLSCGPASFGISDHIHCELVVYLKELKDKRVTFSLCSDAHTVYKVGDTLKLIDLLEETEVKSEQLWNPEPNESKK